VARINKAGALLFLVGTGLDGYYPLTWL